MLAAGWGEEGWGNFPPCRAEDLSFCSVAWLSSNSPDEKYIQRRGFFLLQLRHETEKPTIKSPADTVGKNECWVWSRPSYVVEDNFLRFAGMCEAFIVAPSDLWIFCGQQLRPIAFFWAPS